MRDRGSAARLTSRAIALVAIFAAGSSRADEPKAIATEGAPSVTPPRAIDATDVPYPPNATGEATVILVLTIDAAGHVTSAEAQDGPDPFAPASRQAALTWHFVPAHRGDINVSSRIRIRIAFTPPVSPFAPSRLPVASSPLPPPHSAPPDEVRVRGTRHETGSTSLGGGEVRQIPGAFGDPFRAIEALPGVTPIASGLPFFFVRGAPPGNTGYFVDGVRVPLLYHLALGPSVVHPALIDRVDFFPGGFPARYGRFAGGVLAGQTLPPATRLHGEANVRLFDAGALVESPIADGRGTVLVGGRYSYTGAVVSLVAPDTKLAYWDYQTRATWNLGERDRVSVFAFGSYDYLGQRNGGDAPVRDIFKTEFHRVDVRYDHRIGTDGNVRVAATLGIDRSGSDNADVRDTMAAVRMEIEQPIASNARLRAGTDAVFDHYALTQGVNDNPALTELLYPPRDDVAMGAYVDVVWHAAPRVEIVPGLRVDLFNSHRLDHPPPFVPGFDLGSPTLVRTVTDSSTPTIDPRLAARVIIAKPLAWVSTFGVSHQRPSFFVPVPGLQVGELRPSLQTSYQMSQGFEIALPGEITATATGFLHDYLGLTDLTSTCGDARSTDLRDLCVNNRVRGRTFGAELLVRRNLTKRLTGWIAYTLSRSTREAHIYGLAGDPIVTIPSEFDRTHVLNVVGAYDLGKGWRAGVRFFYYTGRPYSQTYQNVPLPPYDNERLPPFYRLDVRLEKRWILGEHTAIAVVLEGLNVTLRKEAVSVTCTPTTLLVPDRCVPDEIGPVTIPSIGAELVY